MTSALPALLAVTYANRRNGGLPSFADSARELERTLTPAEREVLAAARAYSGRREQDRAAAQTAREAELRARYGHGCTCS